VDQLSLALRTYSPDIPAFNTLIGGMLIVLAVGWLLRPTVVRKLENG
jgi:hypothetical protein